MRLLRRTTRPNYSLCNQTVTIYHRDGSGSITRTVRADAFLDFKKVQNVDKTGSHESNSFLLVIPGPAVPVVVGDKVVLGTGPAVTSETVWADLIPVKVPGMVVVKYVDPKYLNGELVHTEAGG